jgi:hypothetical protein
VSIDPATRHAAYIATAVTLPIVVVAALLIGQARDSGTAKPSASASTPAALAPISVAAPPANAAANAPCTALLGALPVAIPTSDGPIAGRPADSTSPYVVAWGDPAIVLRCGVPRPAQLTVNSADLLILADGVNFLPVTSGKSTVFTAIDRAAFVEITVPKSYSQPPIGPLADAIGTSMKAVCTVPEENGTADPPTSSLCTRRK